MLMTSYFIGSAPITYLVSVFSEKRKGASVGIDFAIGMSIFLLMVAIGLYYTTIIATPSAPFSEQFRDTSTQTADEFERLAEWTVDIVPVTVTAPASVSDYPLEVRYGMPPSYDSASVGVTKDSTATASQFDRFDNTTTIMTSLSNGKNQFEISYTTDTALETLYQEDRINRTVKTLETNNWNTTLDEDGIDSLYFSTQHYVTNSRFESFGASQEWINGTIRFSRQYDNGSIRGFGGASQIRTTQHDTNDSITSHINLSASFSNLETDDGPYSLSDNGTYYNNTTDFATFTYASGGTTYGLTIVGTNMNLVVGRNETGGVLRTNITTDYAKRSLMFRPHTGGPSNVSNERDVYLNQETITGLIQHRNGIADHELDNIDGKTTDSLGKDLRLSNMGFNISIDNRTYGDNIPSGQDVAALEYPLPKLYRWGNTTQITFNLAVWL